MHTPVAERHEAWIGEDLVVLDLASDRYLCTPGADWREAARSPAGASSCRCAADARTAPPDGPDHLRPSEVAALALSLVDLLRLYPGRSLGHVLAAVAARRRDRRSAPQEALRIARAFRRQAVWLPIPRKCLVRSFVLACLLQRCGHGCAWVLGVRTWPFAAHCWLELGGVVLDDRPERLRAFTVIHRVET